MFAKVTCNFYGAKYSVPGTFSLRTLDALRHISKDEAELFRKACVLAFVDGWIAVPGSDMNTSLEPFGFSYGDILTLRDAGLLMEGDNLHKSFSLKHPVSNPEQYQFVLNNNGLLIQLSGAGAINFGLSALVFSQVGRELQRLIEYSPNEEYLKALGVHLNARLVTAKRATSTPKGEGVSIITFEEDL